VDYTPSVEAPTETKAEAKPAESKETKAAEAKA
jgi:hypothetical protein